MEDIENFERMRFAFEGVRMLPELEEYLGIPWESIQLVSRNFWLIIASPRTFSASHPGTGVYIMDTLTVDNMMFVVCNTISAIILDFSLAYLKSVRNVLTFDSRKMLQS